MLELPPSLSINVEMEVHFEKQNRRFWCDRGGRALGRPLAFGAERRHAKRDLVQPGERQDSHSN